MVENNYVWKFAIIENSYYNISIESGWQSGVKCEGKCWDKYTALPLVIKIGEVHGAHARCLLKVK